MASSLFRTTKQNKTLHDQLSALLKGRDPQKAFYEECQKRGVDPDRILDIVKMIKK